MRKTLATVALALAAVAATVAPAQAHGDDHEAPYGGIAGHVTSRTFYRVDYTKPIDGLVDVYKVTVYTLTNTNEWSGYTYGYSWRERVRIA